MRTEAELRAEIVRALDWVLSGPPSPVVVDEEIVETMAKEIANVDHEASDAWSFLHERSKAGYISKARAALAVASPLISRAARDRALDQAATRAAIHSQYPITTAFDEGYAKGRKDAADAIRELKDTPDV